MTSDWPEAQRPKGEPGPIFGFRRGYKVDEAGRHESADQYNVFQHYMRMQGERNLTTLSEIAGYSVPTLHKWSQIFQWERRAAAYDKKQMAIVWKQVEKQQKNSHKQAIVEFREKSEKSARLMSKVSDDLVRLISKRLEQAEDEGEEIPLSMVANLLRAAAGISEQSRQSWASALGVSEMLSIVESEIKEADVTDVTDVDAYDIPLDE